MEKKGKWKEIREEKVEGVKEEKEEENKGEKRGGVKEEKEEGRKRWKKKVEEKKLICPDENLGVSAWETHA